MAEEREIHLGFCELIDDREEFNQLSFPNKSGGIPKWLIPKGLPALQCGICQGKLLFLLQLYAPYDDISGAFHRTLYLFGCPNGKCHQTEAGFNKPAECFSLLRAQLPEDNPYFVKDEEEDTHFTPTEFFSQEYKKLKNGISLASVLKEKEIVIEEEGDCGAEDAPHAHEKEQIQTLLQNYKNKTEEEKNMEGINTDDTREFEERDCVFRHFQNRIRAEPTQVLRYYNTDEPPLFVSTRGLTRPQDPSVAEEPTAYTFKTHTIPKCSNCGGECRLEFQVLPQMVGHLGIVESVETSTIDWGTLLAYTCAASCRAKNEQQPYIKEVVFSQSIA